MTTKIIGIKEFRKNITKIWKEARAKNIRFIVMFHSEPIMEINPINKKEFTLENLQKNFKEGKTKIKQEGLRKKLYSVKDINQFTFSSKNKEEKNLSTTYKKYLYKAA